MSRATPGDVKNEIWITSKLRQAALVLLAFSALCACCGLSVAFADGGRFTTTLFGAMSVLSVLGVFGGWSMFRLLGLRRRKLEEHLNEVMTPSGMGVAVRENATFSYGAVTVHGGHVSNASR